MNWLADIVSDPFLEFAVILFLAAAAGSLGQLLRQPLIVMFIALGIFIGPSALNIIQSEDKIHLLAEIGIALLLFIVGLKLDLQLIKSTGRVALLTGLGQVVFTSAAGYLIGLALGFPALQSLYIAVALTFSSTIIIVKLLTDKKEIDSLHGQIAIGFLIVQDLVVILVMIILSALGKGGEESLLQDFALTFLNGTILGVVVFLLIKWVIPTISAFLAKSQELLTLFSIAWAILLASVSELMGFSSEVGAFLAGVSLASTPFREAISSRLVSLRDFLLLFFFINLGSTLDLSALGAQVPSALIFSFFVLIGNPIIVLIIMGVMGYTKRTSFLAGLTVAQISEFSLIFAGMGYQVGHISAEIVGLITLVGLITIGLSTYMILYSHILYRWMAPLLHVFERKNPYRESEIGTEEQPPIKAIVIGLGRFGSSIANKLSQYGITTMGVDFDPQVVENLRKQGKYVEYGDLEDPDIFERLPYQNADYVINTVPDVELSQSMIKNLRASGYEGKIIVTATNLKNEFRLRQSEPDDILMPFAMAADNIKQRLDSLKRNVVAQQSSASGSR
ncbi:cation:proton antiporter [Pontibacter diazotrophicus]|uniref:Cation:proton antiporter n=1 Tax=Pontibacter diazotrophicus TaxID=1400979 RepID=A0A3D8L852_9BACT|nr:cation:proton antiporter [Pontibacter diazotrophicus]RDV13580.1 cation:proton antiporter [Pontibacter diazotrophicus]